MRARYHHFVDESEGDIKDLSFLGEYLGTHPTLLLIAGWLFKLGVEVRLMNLLQERANRRLNPLTVSVGDVLSPDESAYLRSQVAFYSATVTTALSCLRQFAALWDLNSGAAAPHLLPPRPGNQPVPEANDALSRALQLRVGAWAGPDTANPPWPGSDAEIDPAYADGRFPRNLAEPWTLARVFGTGQVRESAVLAPSTLYHAPRLPRWIGRITPSPPVSGGEGEGEGEGADSSFSELSVLNGELEGMGMDEFSASDRPYGEGYGYSSSPDEVTSGEVDAADGYVSSPGHEYVEYYSDEYDDDDDGVSETGSGHSDEDNNNNISSRSDGSHGYYYEPAASPSPSPPPESVDEYPIEDLIDHYPHGPRSRVTSYRVRWAGDWPAREKESWQRRRNIAPSIIAAYWDKESTKEKEQRRRERNVRRGRAVRRQMRGVY